MSPAIHAITAAFFRSSNDAAYRIYMTKDIEPGPLILLNLFLGGLMLLPFTGFPDLSTLSFGACAGLIAANCMWASQTFFHLKSYIGLGVGMNALLDCLRYVLLINFGWWFFGETFTWNAFAGMSLIVAGILIGASGSSFQANGSFFYRMLSVLSGTIAITLDKYLTTFLDKNVVTLGGFFLPALLFCCARPAWPLRAIETYRSQSVAITVTTALLAGTGFHLIYAFADGDLAFSMTLYQSSILISFLIGFFCLSEKENALRQLSGSLISFCGVAIASLA